MGELAKAIYAYLTTSNTFDTAVGGRVYLSQTPPQETFPYAVMYMLDRDHDWTFDSSLYTIQIQISIYSNEKSSEQIYTLSGYLSDLLEYKNTTLTVTGYDFIYIKETTLTEPSQDEDEVWNCIHRYEIGLEKAE